ncbi:hypothetical protein E2C01_084690 [Portunus trituberculatus]|uniref:Uncharacterized protein n=1 Tax=Portunus trituberculatus TaxID=210409 RepID=A0A5B7IVZ8_PORTR|nr:hypothetical protein [Portunus trituberculatus]
MGNEARRGARRRAPIATTTTTTTTKEPPAAQAGAAFSKCSQGLKTNPLVYKEDKFSWLTFKNS